MLCDMIEDDMVMFAPVFSGRPACVDDPGLMFDSGRKELAKEVCLGCEVFVECAEWAHVNNDVIIGMVGGVWRDAGGEASDGEIDMATAGLKPRTTITARKTAASRRRRQQLEDRLEEEGKNKGGRPRVCPDSRVCPWCEKRFVPGRKEQLCCSRRCSARRREAGKG